MQENAIFNRSATSLIWTALAILSCSQWTSDANAQIVAPVAFEYSYGWETQVKILDSVESGSWIAREAEGKSMRVAFKYDRFWLLFPIWTARGAFVLCEQPQLDQEPTEYWPVLPQNPVEIASLTGADASQLTRPFDYYVPSSWFALGLAMTLIAVPTIRGSLKKVRRCSQCNGKLTSEEGIIRLALDDGEQEDLARLAAGHVDALDAFPVSNWEENEQVRADLKFCPNCSDFNLLTIHMLSFGSDTSEQVIQEQIITQEQVNWIRGLNEE